MVLTFQPWGMIAEIAAFAFAVAGNTIFPAFLLGIWWPRANATGVICGMLTGAGISFAPLLHRRLRCRLSPSCFRSPRPLLSVRRWS